MLFSFIGQQSLICSTISILIYNIQINAQKSDWISMTAVRKDLHWLPINARIEFKMLMLAWKAYNQIGPDYLVELPKKKENRHNTRSSNDYLLNIPQTNLVSCRDRTFKKAAPTLWNALPLELRTIKTLDTFKNKLKTHLISILKYITSYNNSACEHSH